MNKYVIFFLVLTIFFANPGLFAQSTNPKGLVEVIAVKGKILFNSEVLRKSDKFEFEPYINAIDQLEFSSSSDWIKVKEVSSGKIYPFYKQRKYACSNCLGTRGAGDELKALSLYFGKKTLFLFEPDTLIFNRRNHNDIKALAVFRVYLDGKVYERIVGDNDTIIVSRDRVYGFAEEKNSLYPSFRTDSIRFTNFNPVTQKVSVPQLPVFNVIFFEDAVSYLFQAELKAEEIYNELITNFVQLQDIVYLRHFASDSEAEQWLMDKIMEQIDDLKQDEEKNSPNPG